MTHACNLICETCSSTTMTSVSTRYLKKPLTVMRYGQTGSGKTYTMSSFYKQAADELFEHATSKVVSVYFIELLGDKCFDMLHGGTPCNLVSASDGSVHPHPCVEIDVTSASELLAVINMAGKLRATAA